MERVAFGWSDTTPMHYYHKAVLSAIKWIATAYCTVVGLILALNLYDLVFGPYWGYSWRSALFALLMIVVGIGFREGAILALRKLERTNGV
jgi:hypothetical protein